MLMNDEHNKSMASNSIMNQTTSQIGYEEQMQ
jgi:hypothetical protein